MKPIILSILMSLIITGCATQRGFPPVGGIVNFDKVDNHLYRGAQPNQAGLEYLRSLGVGTVINLRMPGDSWSEEKDACERLGMRYVNIPMDGFSVSKSSYEYALLAIQESPVAVFVHCQYGCDRTGTVVACYKIRKGVPNESALQDAKFHGMSAWSGPMKRFIRKFK